MTHYLIGRIGLVFGICAVLALPGFARAAIDKPSGVYASSGGANVLSHPEVQGVLVRTTWEALEPSPGVYDFSSIDRAVDTVENAGKYYSLAVGAGGKGSPKWLIDEFDVPYVMYSFRGTDYKLPLFWDETVQDRLESLAQALGDRYGDDTSLTLVYVPQMTTNGIEGHLQGVDMTAMKNAGYTDIKWIDAGKRVAKSFAMAFPNKAIAFEVHEVNGSADVPSAIINDLWNDPSLDERVGAAMWWISGKETYMPDLIDVLREYPGDIYGQVIGRSDSASRFKDYDYASVFEQAKDLGLRYIEPWEWEFKSMPNGAGGTWDDVFADFNAYALAGNPVTTTNDSAPIDTEYRSADDSFGNISTKTVGYVGCSVSNNAVNGYHANGGNLFWESGDYGSGGVREWARDFSNASKYWKSFDGANVENPADVIWWQLCTTGRANGSDGYDEAALIYDEIKRRAPDADVYISAQPSYSDHNCSIAGANGPDRMQELADTLVANGKGMRGPVMGPLSNSTTVSDGCHANIQGQADMGEQLSDFFESGISPSGRTVRTERFAKNLSRGAHDADVRLLQEILIRLFILAEWNATGYFGPLTEAAVRTLQCQAGIVCGGDAASTGWGNFGPRTRAYLNNR